MDCHKIIISLTSQAYHKNITSMDADVIWMASIAKDRDCNAFLWDLYNGIVVRTQIENWIGLGKNLEMTMFLTTSMVTSCKLLLFFCTPFLVIREMVYFCFAIMTIHPAAYSSLRNHSRAIITLTLSIITLTPSSTQWQWHSDKTWPLGHPALPVKTAVVLFAAARKTC